MGQTCTGSFSESSLVPKESANGISASSGWNDLISNLDQNDKKYFYIEQGLNYKE